MADKKISALPAATTPLAGTEVLPIVQGGTTDQVSVANLTAGRAVSTGALTVVAADTTLDNAYSLKGKLVAGTAVSMLRRNSSDEVAIDEDGYGTKIGFGGRYNFAGGGDFTVGVGNLVVGTAGKGIDFSANTGAAGMTSELLDWYEEGTWTPTYVPQNGSFSAISYGFASGSYVRIGSMVWVSWSMRTSGITVGSASGVVFVGGLPFTSINAAPGAAVALGVGTDFGVNNAGAGLVAQNDNKITLYQLGNNTTITVADLSTGGANNFTSGFVCYRV